MKRNWAFKAMALCAIVMCANVTMATTIWDESANPDLSNNQLAPTFLTAALGSNVVSGTVGNSGSGIDRDYFRFDVPTGAVLSSINLLSASVSGGASFFAIEAGPQITTTPSGQNLLDLLGFTHYGGGDVGSNILPGLLFAPNTAPLPNGTYSVWVQETGGPASYSFDFAISTAPVPEPDTYAMLITGLGLLGLVVRRRNPRVE